MEDTSNEVDELGFAMGLLVTGPDDSIWKAEELKLEIVLILVLNTDTDGWADRVNVEAKLLVVGVDDTCREDSEMKVAATLALTVVDDTNRVDNKVGMALAFPVTNVKVDRDGVAPTVEMVTVETSEMKTVLRLAMLVGLNGGIKDSVTTSTSLLARRTMVEGVEQSG